MKFNIIGWDIGGAHLKAVMLDTDGIVIFAKQVACPLWQGMHHLQQAIDTLMSALSETHANLSEMRHAVTMTGELADIFTSRHDGVNQIAACIQRKLVTQHDKKLEQEQSNMLFYAGDAGFVGFEQIANYSSKIASANWHLSVSYAANASSEGLFIDIGSTTTDLIPFAAGKPLNLGATDAERMRHGELIYTGVVRTPLMALGQVVAFGAHQYWVAAEHFATTADVYRLTGELSATDDMAATADGADKSEAATMRRLARMVGHDVEDADATSWLGLAHSFRERQLGILEQAISTMLNRGAISENAPFIGAGCGVFLVKILADRFDRPFVQMDSLINANKAENKRLAGVCLPAYCAARLMPSMMTP